ncbi:MAG: cadmium-translocating P-type ATPase [Ruminococcus sp.]|nr:cadmium-translocating P-type ATPase [Ruminococcus sp.]
MKKKQKRMLVRIIISGVMFISLMIAGHIVKMPLWVSGPLYLICYIIIGYDILRKAALGIRNGRMLDENFLMAVATIGAAALAIYDKSGDLSEAVAVMLFYQIGEFFQGLAVGKSRKNIASLMDIRPDHANIMQDGKLVETEPDEIEVGTTIIVQPGEKIPIDGVIIKGNSVLDTSALTGESVPREAAEGDEVISGCINMSGLIEVRTTKPFGESTVSKILELVEESTAKKSHSEKFITKFAKVYTPAVCGSALALAVLPPLVNIITGSAANWATWIYRALTFLVISCPCALVISIPLSFFSGIGKASREGILIKGSVYLEALAQTKTVVFDKTGTLTKGVFEVNAIHHSDLADEKLLEYAAYAECSSSHPISKSLQRAYAKEIDRSRVADIKEISGHGVTAVFDGDRVAVGNGKLMKQLGVEYIECHHTGTVIHVAVNGEYCGHIVIADMPKPHSKEAISKLKQTGADKIVMLTGDRDMAAKKAAEDLGITDYVSELLPDAKVSEVEKLLSQNRGGNLAFVGDGINDAPVLSRADIGIAMGAMGSDAAIEAADIVLMDDDPLKIPRAMTISKRCISIVYQNIVFALAVKFGCLILGALGIANMWLAIFADVGVMILAVLNSMRILFDKK